MRLALPDEQAGRSRHVRGGGINRSRVGYKENFKKGGTKCADEVEGQPASRYKL